jgi:hypothetical protein
VTRTIAALVMLSFSVFFMGQAESETTTKQCTLRWGNTTLVRMGQMMEEECRAQIESPTSTPTPPTVTATASPVVTASPTPTPSPVPPTGQYVTSPCLDISGQSNRVYEWLDIGSCPDRPNINIYNSTNITIRNVRLNGGSAGIYALDSSGINVENVLSRNPQGPFPRGQCVQFNKVQGGVIRGLTCQIDGPSDTEDLVNIYMSQDILVENNVAGGGDDDSGCAFIVDGENVAARITFRNNVFYDMTNCGIGVASGSDIMVDGNVGEDRNGDGQAVAGGGGNGIGFYVWNQYAGTCTRVSILNNLLPLTHSNDFWNGGGCTNVTVEGNNW